MFYISTVPFPPPFMPIDHLPSRPSENLDMAALRPMLETIYKDPKNMACRKALRDWLVSCNHPWGEYLAMTIEMEEIDDRSARHTKLLLEKRARFESGHDGTPSKERQEA